MRLARRLVLALWGGLLVAIGGLAAPTLFAVLANRIVAGGVAAELFRRTTFLSIGLALVVCVLPAAASGGRRPLLKFAPLVPALLLAAGEFGVKPMLEAARAASGPAGRAFVAWHATSAGLFGLATLLVVALLVLELKSRD